MILTIDELTESIADSEYICGSEWFGSTQFLYLNHYSRDAGKRYGFRITYGEITPFVITISSNGASEMDGVELQNLYDLFPEKFFPLIDNIFFNLDLIKK